MASITQTFTEVELGQAISVKNGGKASFAVSNDFIGAWELQRSLDQGQSWETLVSGTDTEGTSTIDVKAGAASYVLVRMNCTAFTSGQIDIALAEVSIETPFDDLSPTMVKGDLIARGDLGADRLAVGGDGQILTSDSEAALGVSWQDAPSPVAPLQIATEDLAFAGTGVSAGAYSIGPAAHLIKAIISANITSDDGSTLILNGGAAPYIVSALEALIDTLTWTLAADGENLLLRDTGGGSHNLEDATNYFLKVTYLY